MIVEAATDNKNRTAADLRLLFSKNHGPFATAGSVSYMFHRKGQFTVPRVAANEDRLLELAFEAVAEEITAEENVFVLTAPRGRFYAAAEVLKAGGIKPESQKLTFIPDNAVPVTDEATTAQVLRLFEALEDWDDARNVYSNFDIAEEVLLKLHP